MIKKRNTTGIVLGVVLLVLILSITITSTYINKYAIEKSDYHWSVETDKGTSVVEGIPFDNIDRMFEGKDSNFYSREKLTIDSEYGSVRVNVYGTDKNFFRFNRYPLISGSYFLKKDMENYERYIVIGKSVANGLFKTTDIIGKEVEIVGMKFTIIGVVEDEDLLPVNPFYETEKVAVISSGLFTRLLPNHKAIHGDVRSDKNLGKKAIENILSDEGLPLNTLEISDESKYQIQFQKNLRFVFFIMGALFIIDLAKRVINEYRQLIKRIKSFNREYYLNQWQKLHEHGIILNLAKLTSLIILILIIYKVIAFEFFIDVYYDGNYEINSIGDAFRWVIREISIKHTEYSTSISETIKFLAGVRTISLVLFLITYIQVYYRTMSWIKQKKKQA